MISHVLTTNRAGAKSCCLHAPLSPHFLAQQLDRFAFTRPRVVTTANVHTSTTTASRALASRCRSLARHSSVQCHRCIWQPSCLKTILALMVIHIVLALLMKRFSAIATVHAWGTLALGLVWASRGKPTVKLACLGSYIAGADVLWRMTGAIAFWEMGKYCLIAVFLVASRDQRQLRRTSFPVGYFALLDPGGVPSPSRRWTLRFSDSQVSFNLSGPLALAVAAGFFSRLRLRHEDLQYVLLSFLIPIVAIWTLVVSGIASAEQIVFNVGVQLQFERWFRSQPNFVTAGMWCARCISACPVLYAFESTSPPRVCFLLLALALGAQSCSTFSRSGLYLALAGGVVAAALAARRSTSANYAWC